MEKFTKFYNGIYSNWYMVNFNDENGNLFNNSEQCFMYLKALTFNDIEIANKILLTKHPKDAKNFGRMVRNFDSKTWDAISKNHMYKSCFLKFDQNENLKKQLLKTKGTTLVECAGTKDLIWGCGFLENEKESSQRDKWTGTNWLGETLTKLREDFINNPIKI